MFYCPGCHDVLNYQTENYLERKDYRLTYQCQRCKQISVWELEIAPVPVLIFPKKVDTQQIFR